MAAPAKTRRSFSLPTVSSDRMRLLSTAIVNADLDFNAEIPLRALAVLVHL
jgi:hypothetical protein